MGLRVLLFSLSFLLLTSCSEEPSSPTNKPISYSKVLGADLSFQAEIQEEAFPYLDSSGQLVNIFSYFHLHGWNTARLRIWVNPINGRSSMSEVKDLALQARAAGMQVWLCIHFSDTWADPGNQEIPLAWSNLSRNELGDSVASYTSRVCESIQPEIVQLGNETNPGFMWPQGHIDSLNNFLFLLNRATMAANNTVPQARRMIHLAGFGNEVFWLFNQIEQAGIGYEMVGISYYPRWHGKDIDELARKLSELEALTGKQIGVAETAYPFTLDWNDWTNNIVGDSSALVSGFNPSPQGQKDFLQAIKNITDTLDNCWGMAYWAPDWTAFRGTTATNGSPWENLALFNFDGEALPALHLN